MQGLDIRRPVQKPSQAVQKGRPARPQRVKTGGVPLGYVEDLNDARTPLAGFVTSLLVEVVSE